MNRYIVNCRAHGHAKKARKYRQGDDGNDLIHSLSPPLLMSSRTNHGPHRQAAQEAVYQR